MARMKEEEIRKLDVFNKYLKLIEKDIGNFFNFKSFIEVKCPACESETFTEEFEKLGFKYVSCKTCSTLFVNPRPPFEVIREFYSKSPSTSFWINEFFKPVAEVRREKIFKPRAEYTSQIVGKKKRIVVGDIGGGFGLFLEELKKMLPGNRYVAFEPSEEMADICLRKGLEVKCMFLEDVREMAESFDLLTGFELIEHLFDPASFLVHIRKLLKPNGFFLFTTLNSYGFDIRILWEKSKSVAPPHHLNFFNTTSIKILLEKMGFEIIEISTPGMLDWDIVEGMIKNENVDMGRFWNLLANEESEKCKSEFQNWISRNSLSSHMRVVAKKTIKDVPDMFGD